MELGRVLHSGKLSYGKYAKLFEDKLRAYLGNKLTLAISGNPILFALQLLGIGSGDEVIASPMSCLVTTQPIALISSRVIWADIDPATGTLDPDDVENKITLKTKAIIHYHWAGYPGYIDEINKIGKKYNIPIIEEASMAFGSEYKGMKVGNTRSDIVCFSFSPARLPNTIDGAGLSFNSETLYKQAEQFRDSGITREEFRDSLGEISSGCDIQSKGTNSTLNDLSGYIGMRQMQHIDNLLAKQQSNASKWRAELAAYDEIQLLDSRKEIIPNYWVFAINVSRARDQQLAKYRKQGYYASKLHLRNDLYSVFSEALLTLKGVDEFSDKQLCVPSGWWVDK